VLHFKKYKFCALFEFNGVGNPFQPNSQNLEQTGHYHNTTAPDGREWEISRSAGFV